MVFIGLSWNGVVYYVDWKLAKKAEITAYESCDKIWAARGVYNFHEEENSITAFNRAFALGAKGGEVDFFYDVKSDSFIVSHGKPKQDESGNLIYSLKEGKLLTLEKLFESVPEHTYFWLDYKNLDRLSDTDTQAAINRLKIVAKKARNINYLYIEGSNPNHLSRYTQAGFHTILAVQPLPESHFLSSLSVNIFKVAYYFYDVSALAMRYGNYSDPIFAKNNKNLLSYIPVFLFHVPKDVVLVESLVKEPNVNVLLVGRDESVSMFNTTACK
ncbi:uncharacterized protein MP3633_0577 [Marinomonas primoryensis]|uniref:GP-PDE domain-containing protein n=2 Tax=Marinomonas primoryensis TaxID=178399 RepID=A0A859CSW9_9GAMM|nr:uncharacterized protein MP3633_0577 [Marinomonas primoryensis]